MKKIALLKELEKYSVFNVKILSEIIDKDRQYAKLVIHRLKKEDLIFQIEKNRYTVHKDPLVIASNIIWPCYISGWAGLRYYNLTEQLPQVISVMSTRRRRKNEIIFGNARIIFKSLKPKYFFGYNREIKQNTSIFIAEKEKVLIDCALFKLVSFTELSSIISENIKEVDVEILVNYLVRIKNKALIKRFGFLLDALGIDKYPVLTKFIDFKYISLDYSLPLKGKKNKKWKVIKNVRL